MGDSPSFRLRLHKLTVKATGAVIMPLHQPSAAEDAEGVRGHIDDMLQSQIRDGHRITGFAFVAWDQQGSSVAIMRQKRGGNIPEIWLPDFVRNRLLAEKIIDWTFEQMRPKPRSGA